jgi:hypothetical protein
MKYSRRTQTVLFGSAALIAAIAATAWWLSSPQNVRRAGEGIVLLVGCIQAIEQRRRLPMRSPLLLSAGLLIALSFALLARRAGPIFPTVLAVAVVVAWTCVAIGRLWRRYRGRADAGTRRHTAALITADES